MAVGGGRETAFQPKEKEATFCGLGFGFVGLVLIDLDRRFSAVSCPQIWVVPRVFCQPTG